MRTAQIQKFLKAWEVKKPTRDFTDVQINEYIRLLHWLRPQEGESLVELESHRGELAVALAQSTGPAGQIFSLDHRVDHVRKVISRTSRVGLMNVEAILLNRPYTDAATLPIPDGGVDAICSLGTFHRASTRAERVMTEWARVLDSGGRVVIGDIAPGSRSHRFLKRLWSSSAEGYPFRLFSREDLKDLAERAGLRLVAWEMEPVPRIFSSPTQMQEFLGSRYPGDAEHAVDELGVFPLGDHTVLNWDLAFARLEKP